VSNEFTLLIDGSKECAEAIKILKKNNITFKPILTSGEEGPSLFTLDNEWLGINGIKYFVESRKP